MKRSVKWERIDPSIRLAIDACLRNIITQNNTNLENHRSQEKDGTDHSIMSSGAN